MSDPTSVETSRAEVGSNSTALRGHTAEDTAAALLGSDWPTKAADTVERVVGTVKSKTTGPAILASRIVVYGMVGAVLGIVLAVLLLATLIRLGAIATGGRVWIVDLVIGLVFTLLGTFLWRKRR